MNAPQLFISVLLVLNDEGQHFLLMFWDYEVYVDVMNK